LVPLGGVAYGVGRPGDARYWLESAIAAAGSGADDAVRTRAELLLTALPTEQIQDETGRTPINDPPTTS
ncbi:hypothetical protein ACFVYD_30835, partial [Streptomyces sp. NPDC058301]|uniref:hypothetical protein n=1 Tax=Streptomyces sp. NPDC058301 TaxID=3346436 RepID=UPI0036EB051E